MISLNGKEIEFKKFPNGETLLSKETVVEAMKFKIGDNKIFFKYEDDGDLIRLMFLKKYMETFKSPNNNASLLIYYMPYSRMDRSENGSPFTLKFVSDFINSLNFEYVEIIEPHSDVTPALIDDSYSNYINFKLLPMVKEEIRFDEENDYIMFPDQGAARRYKNMKVKNELIGQKVRNFETGRIESLQIVGSEVSEPNKILIVDDLSSYGGTFLMSAKALKDLGFKEIYLLVGHCENSIFDGDIFKADLINKVFTTDTIMSRQHWWNNVAYKNRLKVYEIEDLLN